MSFPFPPELLGLRPQWANPHGPTEGEYLRDYFNKQKDEGFQREQLAETQRMHRTSEAQQQGELEREKSKDALMAQIANSKSNRKMGEQDTKLFHQYMTRAIQAEAVGDMVSAQQYRNAAQSLVDSAPEVLGPSAEAPPGVHAGMSGPAFGGKPAEPAQRPFIDQGGLEFASSPSGAFRTSKPGAAPEAAPGAEEPPLPPSGLEEPGAKPTGAFGTGFDTSKVGATSPNDVDSAAITRAFLGLPTSTKKHVINLADRVISGSSPSSDLLSNPPEYGKPPEAPPQEGGGQWMRTPEGRQLRVEGQGRPDAQSVVAMWKSRAEAAQDPVEKAGAEAAAAAAGVSQNAQKAQDEGQKAYDGALRRFKREGAGGGGGGPGAPSGKVISQENADWDKAIDKAREQEGVKDAVKGISAANRGLAQMDHPGKNGFMDRSAFDETLKSIFGARATVKQFDQMLNSAGLGEAWENKMREMFDKGELSDEFKRQMRAGIEKAKSIWQEVLNNQMSGAEAAIRYKFRSRPPEDAEAAVGAARKFILHDAGEVVTPGNNSKEPTRGTGKPPSKQDHRDIDAILNKYDENGKPRK